MAFYNGERETKEQPWKPAWLRKTPPTYPCPAVCPGQGLRLSLWTFPIASTTPGALQKCQECGQGGEWWDDSSFLTSNNSHDVEDRAELGGLGGNELVHLWWGWRGGNLMGKVLQNPVFLCPQGPCCLCVFSLVLLFMLQDRVIMAYKSVCLWKSPETLNMPLSLSTLNMTCGSLHPHQLKTGCQTMAWGFV